MSRLAQRFALERQVGSGGMATVYLGTDEVLDRPVAVKVLKSGFGETDIGERFRREGRTAARLSHPNVVQVYDAGEGELEGRTASFIVMEYVPGGDLKQLIDGRGYVSAAELARLGSEAASGLAHAHEKGVIHRDIKPHNILLDGHGRCKLTDFGIARALDSAGVTQSGDYLGTALYSAPEQLRGQEVTPKSDVYSLGATLFQAAAGEPPFSGSPLEVANQHVNKPPALPEHLTADAPGRGLGRLILDCLAKDPRDRPDAETVRERLSELAARGAYRPGPAEAAAAMPAGARGPRRSAADGGSVRDTAGRKAGRKRRRNRPLRVVMAALAVAVLFAGGAFALLESDQPPQGEGQPAEPAGTPVAEPDQSEQDPPEAVEQEPPESEVPEQEPRESGAPASGAGEPEAPEGAGSSPEPVEPGAQSGEPAPDPAAPPEDSGGDGEGPGSPSGGELSVGDAERTVEEVYLAAASGDYERSYGLLSSRFQRETAGSPEDWASTFETLERISFVQGPEASVSGGTAEVTGETRAVHTDRTESNTGSWTLVREDGQWKLDGVSIQTRQV